MTKHALYQFLSFVFGLSLILASLIFCVESVVFNRKFYLDLYDKIDLASTAQASEEDLEKSIFAMTDYVQGKRDDLDETITWKGEVQKAFNEKEILHMKDVKKLYRSASLFRWILVVLAAFLAILFFVKKKKMAMGWLARGYLMALASFAIFLTVLAAWMMIDFTSFWISFHHVFFSNMLWALNPQTDFMIILCPEEMFSTMIAAIVFRFVIVQAILGLASWYILRKRMPIGFDRMENTPTPKRKV